MVILTGCANMAAVPPGTPLSEVQAKFGAPDYSCKLANGETREIWTQQPMGQYAWGTNVAADGRIGRITPILTDEHFQRLAQGVWSAGRVRCEFGPPADIDQAGLPNVRQVVWSYRYRQSGVFNSLMYVYLGPAGDKVTRFHPGPDPLYDEWGDNGWH